MNSLVHMYKEKGLITGEREIIAFPGITWNIMDYEVLIMSIPVFSGFGALMTVDLKPDHDLREADMDMNRHIPQYH